MKCPGHFQRLRPNPFTRFISIGLCSFLLYSSLFSSLSRLRRTLCEQKCEAAPVFPSTLPDCAQCGSGWGQNTSSLNQEHVSVCWAAWLVPSNSSCICYLFMFFTDPILERTLILREILQKEGPVPVARQVQSDKARRTATFGWDGTSAHHVTSVRVCVCVCVCACVWVCVTSK